jgi:hypothetical protein
VTGRFFRDQPATLHRLPYQARKEAKRGSGLATTAIERKFVDEEDAKKKTQLRACPRVAFFQAVARKRTFV